MNHERKSHKRRRFRATAPPFLDYLKDILRRYPDGGQILKELIQNADDAKATEVVFLYDERNYGTENLWEEDLHKFQGPALLAYNNSVFTEEDWKGIQATGRSVKSKDPNRIGRFGIGFNSIYHITDLPCIFSGKNVGFMDPQEKYFDDGGYLWSLEHEDDQEDLQKHPNQFEPLKQILRAIGSQTSWDDLLREQNFQGTLFRFPLREELSQISDNLYDQSRVFDLFDSFTADADMSLLFLKNVASISLKHIDRDGTVKNILTITASQEEVTPGGTDQERLELLSGADACSVFKVITSESPAEQKSCKWLVSTFTATGIVYGELHKLAEKLNYRPCIGLAFPLDKDHNGEFKGRLSCFLPLPDNDSNTTGLPVHVNACFGLTDNRRYIKWVEEDQKHDEAAQWNELLVEKLLPPAYCHIILDAIALTLTGDPLMNPSMTYNLWPDLDSIAHKERWATMANMMATSLVEYRVLCSAHSSTNWIYPKEAVFQERSEDVDIMTAVESFLLSQRKLLVKVPSHVYRTVQSVKEYCITMATPEFINRILKTCNLNSITRDQKMLLLEFILRCEDSQGLKGVPLLPLSDGSFTTLQASNYGEKVFIDSEDFPRTLLPGLAKRFISEDLKPTVLGSLRRLASKNNFNLQCLNVKLVTENIKDAFPFNWARGSDHVTWDARNHLDRSDKWLPQLWHFLKKHCPTDLRPFEGLPVIPLRRQAEAKGTVVLARLIKNTTLIFQELNGCRLRDEMVALIGKLGGTVIKQSDEFLDHPKLKDYIFLPSVSNFLTLLSNLGVDAVKSKLSAMPVEERNQIRNFISEANSFVQAEKSLISELPIFHQMLSLASPNQGLIAATNYAAINCDTLPCVPGDVVLPKTVLKCTGECDRKLLLQLKGSLLSAADVALQIVTGVENGLYRESHQKDTNMLWILRNSDMLFNQQDLIRKKCETLKFLNSRGTGVQPSALFDPEVKTFKDLLSCDFFPSKDFNEKGVLKTLRRLGLRSSLGDIHADEFLIIAREVDREKNDQARKKSDALVAVCNDTDVLSKFSSKQLETLCSLAWVQTAKPTEKQSSNWYKPKDIKDSSLGSLVGLVIPLTTQFNRKACQALGLTVPPPPAKVIENLKVLSENYKEEDKFSILTNVNSIYSHIQKNLDKFTSLTDLPIWNGDGFSQPKDIILAYPKELDLSHCMKKVPPELSKYSDLLKKCGVKPSLSPAEVVNLLYDLQKNIDSRTASARPEELQLAISVLEWMRKTNQDLESLDCENDLPVPVHKKGMEGDFCLQPLSKVLYRDISPEALDDLQQDEEEFHVVHKEILQATAEYLHVHNLSTRILKPEFIEQCGQSEAITLRIKNILKEYDEESDLFKELIQNAEDAKATVCCFLVDMRQNKDSPESLIDPGMASCHGPALWSHNNEVFTEDDFKNITKIGSASKEHQVEKIGNFGLGFNAVYHITDIPSILSGKTLLIFDPNVTHLQKHIKSKSNPGIKLDLSRSDRVLKRFPGQFKPYHNIFGCNIKADQFDYKGTLIKLPFRTIAEVEKSEISTKCYDESRIQSLTDTFKETSQNMLLFLRRVEKVSLEVLSQTASAEDQSSATTVLTLTRKDICKYNVADNIPFRHLQQNSVSKLERFNGKCRGIIDINTFGVMEITSEVPEAPQMLQYWLVHSCFGVGKALQMVCDKRLLALPLGSVAAPLIQSKEAPGKWRPDTEAAVGQVFCFLPLSIHSGLPVHINGSFSVTSNRKNIWTTGLKGDWNEALLQDAVNVAYVTTLLQLQKMCQESRIEGYNYYTFWPNMEKVLKPFTATAKAFYEAVAKGFQGHPLNILGNGNDWCDIDHARFLDYEIINSEKIGKAASKEFADRLKRPLQAVNLPDWVRKGFTVNGHGDIIDKYTYDWIQFYSEIVFDNLQSMDACTRNAFILHAIDLRNPSIDELLKAQPCIPSSKRGELQYIHNLIHPKGKVAPLYDKEEGRIPTGEEGDFLHPERLTRLETLGMIKDEASISQLIERAQTVEHLWQQNKAKAYNRVQNILALLSNVKVNNTVQEEIQDIVLLPAHAPISPSNIALENICLVKPKDLYSHKHKWLVNMIQPVLAKNELGTDFKISSEVKSILGLDKDPSLDTVLLQLKKALKCCHKIQPTEVKQIAEKCYSYLNKHLKETHSSRKILARELKFNFILVEGKFVPFDKVAHQVSFDAAPYLYKLPEEYTRFEDLWKCVGIKKLFSLSDYSSVLQQISDTYKEKRLNKSDLELSLRVITTGFGELPEEDIDSFEVQKILLPDDKCVLRPVSKLHYNDTPWLELGENKALCHKSISREVALRLKVQTTKHKALADMTVDPLSRWMKPFGAHEELTARLSNIIKAYPSKKDILKELIQNADDAKATEIHFIWDQRHHPTKKTFGEKWIPLQGPALCVYNNKRFTEADFEGIQQLGEGGKGNNPEKTGKYGLGFNSVYHLTDCPSFVSGNSRLCVFDPSVAYLQTATNRDPGGEIAINNEFRSTFSDVYDTYLPSLYDLDMGTLFRIPLRTPEMALKSKIANAQVVNDEDINSLVDVLREDSDSLILFLNNIQKITFQKLGRETNKLEPLLTVEMKMSEESIKKRKDFQEKVQKIADLKTELADIEPYQTVYNIEIHCKDKRPTQWILAKQVGIQEEKIRATMQDLKLDRILLPHGAIAASLNSDVRGRAFCSLPLPVETGLPVHVNGNFAVDFARRDLWKQDGSSVKTEWNENLKIHVIAPLYGDLLSYIIGHLFPDRDKTLRFQNKTSCENHLEQFLGIFPCMFENIHPQWQKTVSQVYRSIHARKQEVIPLFRLEKVKISTFTNKILTVSWSSVGKEKCNEEPHFMIETCTEEQVMTLQNMDMKLVLPFETLKRIFEEFKKAGTNATSLNPESLRKFLMAHPLLNKESSLSVPVNKSPMKKERQLNILLEYCLKGVSKKNRNCLEGLPLLLTQDNIVRRFQLRAPKYTSQFHDLFPDLKHLFANSHYNTEDTLKETGFLKAFTVAESAQFIRGKLSREVTEDDCHSWPVLPKNDEKWIKKLWEYFHRQFHISGTSKEEKKADAFKELKTHFSDLAILPVLIQHNEKILTSLNCLQNVVYEAESDRIGNLLSKIGFAQLDRSLLEFDIGYHVIKPHLLQTGEHSLVLDQLTRKKEVQWSQLSNSMEYDTMLQFLFEGLQKCKDKQSYKNNFRSLPLFEMTQGCRQSIDRFEYVYILKSKYDVICPELYQMDKTIALLKDTPFNQELAKELDIKVINDLEFFTSVILGRLQQLSESQMLHAINLLLKIMCDYPSDYEKSKNQILSALKLVKFIRDMHGSLREASFFYDKEDPLFKAMDLKEKFIPQSSFKNVQPEYMFKILLIDLGMKMTPSQDDLLYFASLVAQDAAKGAPMEILKLKTDALLDALFKINEKELDADFLETLSHIKFIYPYEVCSKLCDLHPPYVGGKLFIALKGSMVKQRDNDDELVWTSMPILPFQDTAGILKKSGALHLPPQDLVLQNLKNVSGVDCKTKPVLKTRTKVMKTAYVFLQKKPFYDPKSLSDLPVILVEDNTRLVKSNQVVLSLKNDKEFRPYLYKLPFELDPYRDLFQGIGVSKKATPVHFCSVLRALYEDTKGMNCLQPNQIKTAKRTVQHLFKSLLKNSDNQDFQSLKPLYLPATDGKLYESSSLYYNDRVTTGSKTHLQSLEEKFTFLVKLKDCYIKWDIYTIQKLFKLLPEEIRPKMLSHTTKENLEESTLKLCLLGENCDFQLHLLNLLVSPSFGEGVICLLKEQYKEQLTETESVSELKEIFSKISITCCEKLETVLVYNSEHLKNTNIQKQVYLQKDKDGHCDFFVAHQDGLQGRKMLKTPKGIAQEINVLLKNMLNENSMLILLEMLCCDDPEDIYNVLIECDIHYFNCEGDSSFNLPDPGEVIPNYLWDLLEMDFLNHFEKGDFVGYLDPSSWPEEVYLFAIVVECLGTQKRADGEVLMYRIQIGSENIVEVTKTDIYQFKRAKGVNNNCRDLVPVAPGEEQNEIPAGKFSKSFDEIKKEIDEYFEKISKLPKEERDKAIRRLYLKWHPDKNLDNSELATEVCKYIEQLKEGRRVSAKQGKSQTSENIFRTWSRQARNHKQGRSDFKHRYSSWDHDFFSFHHRYQPNPEEAKRWFKQAECDLSAASVDVGQSTTEWVFFKVHQAVEKALIAAQYRKEGRYTKDQNIVGLAKTVSAFHGSLTELIDIVCKLKHHGVDSKKTQYPNCHAAPNIPNGQFPSDKEQEVLELGKSLLAKIQDYIS
ncbi:sacsin-like [Acipenser oxyrinchus oxyrinchus]|uniref:Sacsin-like n=1 Tax=Acipenser oxyrinchus oxyrinchus TaxID=40147 RepID=A0AAD8CRP1_ACIOX|nr:sacsin-like [Acipenser oxyrinchus oxyrinchus]